ncbi:ABC transporter ATP-binding protein [Lyticum sinuosum]|uniref:ABC transporter ATP-binding/permease protein n=1 Tax=Lyticum sinuosum TaxID=1332059 RepID=A0AAE4VKB3_9RICK|nr:ABC transporter ATP-binding protein [Lyticum sinuosum]MDZ5761541.1 ABC transporter ATP-binding/permease protein [Lyticum sinuosum]
MKKKNQGIQTLCRLIKEYGYKQKKLIITAIISLVIISITGAVNVWILKPLLDRLFLNQSIKMLWMIPIVVFINTAIRAVSSFYESSARKIISYNIGTQIQLDLYKHIIHADNSMFDEYPSGKFISHFTSDINAMRNACTTLCISLVQDILNLLCLGGLMFIHNPSLSFISLTIFPITAYSIIHIGQKIRKIARNMYSGIDDFMGYLDDTLTNISIVKAYNREDYEINRIKLIVERFLESSHKAAKMEAIPSPLVEMLGSIAMTAIIIYGGYEVIAGGISPGELISFIAALFMTYRPLKNISQSNTTIQEGITSANRIFNILDAKPIIADNENSKEVVINNGKVVFKKINFAYKSRKQVLKNFNLEIQPGKTIAFVGHSGVGKSTVIQLLQRFYEPDSGEIIIDGYSIKDITISSLRKAISLVSQDSGLFDDTIIENIRYGKLNATDEEVYKAAKAAAAHDFISKMPEGYYTKIGKNGGKLSGGQRQRIAIARAILKNSPILLLDEATSSLDIDSEEEVQKAINNLRENRTTIIIAHRLSTIKNADLICFLSKGYISECGTHSDLIKEDKKYARFFKKYNNNDLI